MNQKYSRLKQSIGLLLFITLLAGCGGSAGGTTTTITVPKPVVVVAPVKTHSNLTEVTIKGEVGATIYLNGKSTNIKIGNSGEAILVLSTKASDKTVMLFVVTIKDSAGNMSQATTIKIIRDNTIPTQDTTKPIITLNGDTKITITINTPYHELGATANDNVDGVLSVTIVGKVNSSKTGTYTISYIAIDKAGNKATATRTVIVKPADVVWNVSNVTAFRQALEDASANGENDTIILTKGVYNTTSDGLGTFKFNDNEEFNLTIKAEEGLTYKDVILDGNNSSQVFNFNNTQKSTLILKKISIINGNNGVFSTKNIKIEDSNISNHKSRGMYSLGSITVLNSIISNNNSDDCLSEEQKNCSGAGFYSVGSTTIIDSNIFNNITNMNGGGFYSRGLATVVNSVITNNSSYKITDGYFFRGGEGGGFYSNSGVNISNSLISNNYAAYRGGGFYSKRLTSTNITASFISNNYGGAMSSWSTTIINSVFAKNHGEISSADTSYISNNIFIENNGSIKLNGIFVNNIFSKNNSTIELFGNSKLYNNYIDYSKIKENGYSAVKKNNLQPSSMGDIYLSDDNKTLTEDSPVIDKGLNPSSATYKKIIDNDTVYNKLLKLLKTDMVGNKRVYNGTIDMGAVEYGSSK